MRSARVEEPELFIEFPRGAGILRAVDSDELSCVMFILRCATVDRPRRLEMPTMDTFGEMGFVAEVIEFVGVLGGTTTTVAEPEVACRPSTGAATDVGERKSVP